MLAPECSTIVLLLAAAVARRHPQLAGAVSGPLATGAPKLVEKWARSLHGDLRLDVSGGSRPGASGALVLHMAGQREVFLQPAFERANAALEGLGWRLVDTLEQLSGHNPVVTPFDLFWRLCYDNWYEAKTDKEFKKVLAELFDEGEASAELDRPGPDSYWKDFPGLPRDDVLRRQGWRRRKLWSGRTCKRHAKGISDPWTRELLAAMADAAGFASRHLTPVFHVQPNDADWQQCPLAYWVRWKKGDRMTHWLDVAYDDSWNNGVGTDATLVYDCPSPRHYKPADIQASLDKFVEAAEGCSSHIPVMDRLFAVIDEAGE